MLVGNVAPSGAPLAAAGVLLLLLLTEAAVLGLVLSGLCQTPHEWPNRLGACYLTVLCLPCAGIVAPLCGLALLTTAVATVRGARVHRREALAAAASGKLTRDLHLGALWNAASLPNALAAQLCFVPLALAEATDEWRAALLMLLPACLITTKLFVSQAYMALAAAASVSVPVERMLAKCDERGRIEQAAAANAVGID